MSLADALTIIVVVWLGLAACYVVCWAVERLRRTSLAQGRAGVTRCGLRRRAGYWTSPDDADTE